VRERWDGECDPLLALRGGDAGPFEEFVRAESSGLIGFFLRLGADPLEAEDLAQDVFLKLFRGASAYEPRSRFSSFVLRVARNAWIDRRRRRAARVSAVSLDDESGSPNATANAVVDPRAASPSELEADEDRRRLEVALRQLPEAHATVLELALGQSLPYSEIASLLEIPVGTVKSRVFNALRKLRELLEEPARD
jgi:RNA polymerase sigma-70 factor (ECF subfamily)